MFDENLNQSPTIRVTVHMGKSRYRRRLYGTFAGASAMGSAFRTTTGVKQVEGPNDSRDGWKIVLRVAEGYFDPEMGGAAALVQMAMADA